MKVQESSIENVGHGSRSVLDCGGRLGTPPLLDPGRAKELRRRRCALKAHSKAWRTDLLALFCFIILWSTCCLRALGQYAIDWHTLDGGGGTSTGNDGRFSVSGTIGQPDASGPMIGSGYSLTGGFWSLYAVQTAGAPLLSIAHTSTNTVVVFWPASAIGWALQQNTNSVSSVNWSNVTATIQDDGTTKALVEHPSPLDNRFYRLFKP